MKRYCILCGNEQTASKDGIGEACQPLIKGPLAVPYAKWMECGGRYSRCCGRIGTEKDHLYFHGDGWECSYKPMEEMDGTSVEMGVSFYADHAATYYIRDFGNYSDSQEYGEDLPYDIEGFWEKLDAQLDKAAEFAWNNDLLSCERCGNHYVASNGPCGCEPDEEEEEDAE